jgi:hypothetical protein
LAEDSSEVVLSDKFYDTSVLEDCPRLRLMIRQNLPIPSQSQSSARQSLTNRHVRNSVVQQRAISGKNPKDVGDRYTRLIEYAMQSFPVRVNKVIGVLLWEDG